MNVDLAKRNTWIFRFVAILAVLALPLMACESTPSLQPEATGQRQPTQIASPETAVIPPESTSTNTALPSPTAIQVTITPSATPVSSTETPVEPAGQTPSAEITPSASLTSPLQIRQLRMIDINTGWAEDTGKRILRTTQGVRLWKNVSPPYPESDFRTAAYFLDSDTAFLVTGQMVPTPKELKAQIVPWRTVDGGRTWQAGDTLSIRNAIPFFTVQLYFLDKKHGWLLGKVHLGMSQYEAVIMETKDNGFHWEIIYRTTGEPGALFAPGMLPFGNKIMFFVSDLRGFATNAFEQLVTSQDGGLTWQALELEQPGDYPHLSIPVSFVLPPLFSSDVDGVLPVRVYERKQLEMPPCCIFHGLPHAQYLYYTHDAGQTWLPRPSPAKIGAVSFLNLRLGWFLGKDDPSPSAGTQLYMTSDGGETWSRNSADALLPLGTEIQFIDEQTGFAYNPYTGYETNPYHELDSRSGVGSYLFTSKDGGRSWSQVAPQLIP